MIAGGTKLDSPTVSHEIFTSTLGLIYIATSGPVMVTSGHAVGDVGSPIVAADGVTLGHVTHNSYLRGPVKATASPSDTVGGDDPVPLPPPFEPAGPDVASASWAEALLGLPLTAILSIAGGLSVPLPVTGGGAPAPAMPIKVLGASTGMRLGVVEQADATVTDARTQAQVPNVAVGSYASSEMDAGAPILSLDLKTHLPIIVGFHGGSVQEPEPGAASSTETTNPTEGPKSWFVPWPAAQEALGLPPFP